MMSPESYAPPQLDPYRQPDKGHWNLWRRDDILDETIAVVKEKTMTCNSSFLFATGDIIEVDIKRKVELPTQKKRRLSWGTNIYTKETEYRGDVTRYTGRCVADHVWDKKRKVYRWENFRIEVLGPKRVKRDVVVRRRTVQWRWVAKGRWVPNPWYHPPYD